MAVLNAQGCSMVFDQSRETRSSSIGHEGMPLRPTKFGNVLVYLVCMQGTWRPALRTHIAYYCRGGKS